MASLPSLETLQHLIAFGSVSSTSNRAISDWVGERLKALGFAVETTSYRDRRGIEKVNLVGRRDPTSPVSDRAANAVADNSGGLAYFCHTDVVPAKHWSGPGDDPFAATIRDERLYGRGACDMKGSLACMLAAADAIRADDQSAPLWIVCTADEEVGFEGAKHLVTHSPAYRDIVRAQPLAMIGEPTRLSVVHAHKGICGFRITSRGRAAHSSTTDGVNANEAIVPMLQTLLELNEQTRTDPRYLDTRFDPPTLSWNFGVSDGRGAINVTAETCVAWVSLRPMPEIDGEDLIQVAADRALSLGLEFERFEGGAPFWSEPQAESILELCKIAGGESRTVCYGTDGGEFTELTRRVVFGPGSIAQAHTTDEFIELDQLHRGQEKFREAIRRWCVQGR